MYIQNGQSKNFSRINEKVWGKKIIEEEKKFSGKINRM